MGLKLFRFSFMPDPKKTIRKYLPYELFFLLSKLFHLARHRKKSFHHDFFFFDPRKKRKAEVWNPVEINISGKKFSSTTRHFLRKRVQKRVLIIFFILIIHVFVLLGEKIHTEEEKALMCETERKNIFPGECFFPRMRKRKIACKEPSELKIFQEIFKFFVNRTKKPHKWKKKLFSCQNSFI